MYFALAGMMEMFHYLHYGLSLILVLWEPRCWYPITTRCRRSWRWELWREFCWFRCWLPRCFPRRKLLKHVRVFCLNASDETDCLLFHEGVLQEFRIVVSGEVSAVVGPTALFPGQSQWATRRPVVHRLWASQAGGCRMGDQRHQANPGVDGPQQTSRGTDDADVIPHQILNLADDFRGSRVRRVLERRRRQSRPLLNFLTPSAFCFPRARQRPSLPAESCWPDG